MPKKETGILPRHDRLRSRCHRTAWRLSHRGLSGFDRKRPDPRTVLVFVNLMNFIIDPITQMPTLLANRKAALALIRKLSDALEEHSGRGGQAIQSRLTHGISLITSPFPMSPESMCSMI